MRLWNYTIREIRNRPGRTLLTFTGITLGLATVVATQLTCDAARRAYRDLFESLGGGPVLEITAPDMGSFAADLARPLASIAGVRAVVPQVQGVAAVAGKGGNLPVPVLGDDTDGPPGDGDALLDANLAQALGLTSGESLVVWFPSGPATLHVTGLLKAQRGGARGGRLVVSLAGAQRLFALAGRVNSLQVRLADGADSTRVQAELTRRLPAGLVVQPPGTRGVLGHQTLLAAERGLTALSIVALAAAGGVVLNTFLLNLSERRRQLAILRALGATQGQVTRLLLREALLLGGLGTVTGCAAGVVLAAALLAVMEQYLGIALPRLSPAPEPFLAAAILGPGTALAATVLPAWLAGRRPPLAELLPAPCANPLPRLTARLPLGLIGTLAGQQLTQYPLRSGLAGSVLALALAVTLCFGQTVRGIRADLRHWYATTIVADFLVYGSVPDTGFLLTTALPGELAEEIGHLEGVETVEQLAFVPVRSGSRAVLLLARTFSAMRPLPLDLAGGDESAVRRGLREGQVVLGVALARQMGLHRGDPFPLMTPRGPIDLRVAGTVVEYAAGGSAAYLEWEAAGRLLAMPGPHVFLVSARAGGVAALAPRLRDFCDRRHLVLESNADLRSLMDRDVARITGALAALMGLIFVIAALGIVNTLLRNVHEQRRQFGILRALGMTRGQIRRIVLAQGLLLGLVSLIPGAATGIALAFLIQRLGMAGSGTFRLSGSLLFGACALTVAVALLASLLPARQTLRLSVAEILKGN
jgi:putative ABC transport system permease protein